MHSLGAKEPGPLCPSSLDQRGGARALSCPKRTSWGILMPACDVTVTLGMVTLPICPARDNGEPCLPPVQD